MRSAKPSRTRSAARKAVAAVALPLGLALAFLISGPGGFPGATAQDCDGPCPTDTDTGGKTKTRTVTVTETREATVTETQTVSSTRTQVTIPAVLDPIDGPPRELHTFNIEEVSGDVFIQVTGSAQRVRLVRGAQIPLGSVIDARGGSVRLTVDNGDALQTAVFFGGVFAVSQGAVSGAAAAQSPRRLITRVTLRGRGFRRCRARARARGAVAARRRGVVRRLWGNARGRFRTRGRYAAGTVRGTVWLTEDRCGSTRVSVRRGSVSVWDLLRKRRFHVRRGHSYVASRLHGSRP
jgi:hypothetical protein